MAIVQKQYVFKKLSKHSIQEISNRLQILYSHCPHEFSRRPRSLEDVPRFKATEYRQILLYTGPAIFMHILDKQTYEHFLLLHSACRLLSKTCILPDDLGYAEIALKMYVDCCRNIYGPTFMSYNVHGLLHVVDDVRVLGNLDSYSAFPYENNMRIFRKYVRKPSSILQQLHLRIEEDTLNYNTSTPLNNTLKFLQDHSNGLLLNGCTRNIKQYRGLHFEYFRLMSNDKRSDCVLLKSQEICVVRNVLKNLENNDIKLIVQKFRLIEHLYDIPYAQSKYTGVFLCSEMCDEKSMVPLTDLESKCYRMPYWQTNSTDSDKFIVATLLSNN